MTSFQRPVVFTAAVTGGAGLQVHVGRSLTVGHLAESPVLQVGS